MKLVVLGTAGYHPNDHRQTTSIIIPEAGMVFDAGTGLFRVTGHIQTDSIDIFLSHAHLDHVAGLTYLYDVLYERPLEEVRVHGAAHKLQAIREHLFDPNLFPVEPPYVDVPIEDEVFVGEARVTNHDIKHPGGSLAYRIDWPDRSLAIVTDTTASPDEPYIDFIRGVDLLIHECNFADGLEDLAEKTGHSCLTPVAQVARAAEVGGLVLIHFNPLMEGLDAEAVEKAEEIFAPIVVTEDGMEIEF